MNSNNLRWDISSPDIYRCEIDILKFSIYKIRSSSKKIEFEVLVSIFINGETFSNEEPRFDSLDKAVKYCEAIYDCIRGNKA